MKSLHNILSKILIISFSIICINSANSQYSQEWTHRYTGPEASADSPNDFVTDNAGNMYATGQSLVGGGFFKCITVKFNAMGVRQWIAKYQGPPNSNNAGNALQVDQFGNVYITAFTKVSGANYDILTIKYNSAGVQQWEQIYNGTGNFDDFSKSLAIDSNGDIYVAGYSFGIGTSYDYVLIKYNSAGTPQWTQRWNGASNKEDYLIKMLLESNGDIVLTGSSNTTSSGSNFATVKYNSAGVFQWAQIYNGTANSNDQPNGMFIDAADNIFVCGQAAAIAAGYDATLIKYDPAGSQQWVRAYNGPSSSDDVSLAIDGDAHGNIVTTGYTNQTGSYFDYLTIRYNSAGAQQWVKTFNGPENFFDKANDIKIDSYGDPFVTGQIIKSTDGTSDCFSIKYDTLGNILWTKSYNGPGNLDDIPFKLLLDNLGSPIILATSYSYFFSICGSSDYLILKYSGSSELLLETRYDGSGNGPDEARSLAADNNGNCYVTGSSFDNVSNYDFATLKYNKVGAPLWAARFDGGINGVDKSVAVTYDNSGNVYVTGYSQGTSSGFDIATIKYNSLGAQQWMTRYNGPANGDDFASAIAVDVSGNTYVTGYSEGSGSGKDYVTIKYNSSGVQQWASRYNGSANSNDYSYALSLDISGNIFVTGKITSSSTLQDICTVKYNSGGAQQWASIFNGTANDSDEASCLKIDNSGNVIVAGKSKSPSSKFDFITIKYNTSGAEQWVRTYNGTSNDNDEVTSLDCDINGNIILSGDAKNSGTDYDFTTIKYDNSGNQLWLSSYNGTSNSMDKPNSVCTDLSGNTYVSGFTTDIGTGTNYCTVKYNKDGLLKWYDKYNYIDNDSDMASSVKVDTSGNVYVTGFSTSIESKRDFFTTKYQQTKAIELKVLIEGMYYESIDKMISDSMKIYLRNSVSPYAIVDSSVAVIDSTGYCSATFQNAQNNVNYFIVLTNSRSLETWSSAGKTFLAGSLYYDFTSAASQAYGNNLKLKGSKYCAFSGDVIKDGVINLADVILIFNQVTVFAAGYNVADLNGDNIVNLTDMVFAFNNSTSFVSLKKP